MKKEPIIVDAFIYFKNQKVAMVKGIVDEDENKISFTHEGFKSTCAKSELSCIVLDCAPELLEIYADQEVQGFELYLNSGTSQGFNGWMLEPNHYLSKQGDYLEIFEPVCYLKQGPEDPNKNPKEAPKKEEPVGNKKDKS